MTVSSGGEAIVSGLIAHGVDTVFGLPGAQIYGLFDAFQQAQLKVIGARHEQACGYMAYGYARSTGRPGVFSVVPGPGVLNAGAALLTAFGSNEPVLCLTGQVPTAFLDKGRGHLHEMPDQLATLRTFVKWADRIEYPDVAPAMVSRAFQEMLEERAVQLGFAANRDQFRGSLHTLTANLDEAVDMLRLALTEPRFDDEPVARIRDQLQAQLVRNKSVSWRMGSAATGK